MRISSSLTNLIVSNTSPQEGGRLVDLFGAKKTPLGTYLLPKVRASFYRLRETTPILEIDSKTANDLFMQSNMEISHPYWESLYSFQQHAVQFSLTNQHPGQLISLSPGLGKTIVSIMISDLRKARRILVAAPLILLPTWEKEIIEWSIYDHPIQRYRGEGRIASSGWIVTNFEQVARHPERFKGNWDLIVIDESIRIKSRDAKRSKAIHTLVKQSKKTLLLSGIPQTSNVSDLWSQFRAIDHKLFPSFWRFANTYCYVVKGIWGDEILGSRDGIDFGQEFSDLMFIRKSEEVLNLPPIISRRIILEMPKGQQKTVYLRAQESFKLLLETGQEIDLPTRLVQMNRLQQILSGLENTQSGSGSIKADGVVDLILADEIEFPLLIWGFWTAGMEALYFRLQSEFPDRKIGIIQGKTPLSDREYLLTEYRAGRLDILIMGYGVGKYGLTLTNTKTVIPYDKVFGLDDVGQATYRTQRIGLDHSVVVISLEVKGTIDEYIGASLGDKLNDLAKLGAGDILTLLSFIGRN